MSRPSNPNNRYSFICKVTGETVKTNPKQFNELAKRYNISPEELDVSYVGRMGRRIITGEKLTPEQTVEKYNIHINVANKLKCTRKTENLSSENKVSSVQKTEITPSVCEEPESDKSFVYEASSETEEEEKSEECVLA